MNPLNAFKQAQSLDRLEEGYVPLDFFHKVLHMVGKPSFARIMERFPELISACPTHSGLSSDSFRQITLNIDVAGEPSPALKVFFENEFLAAQLKKNRFARLKDLVSFSFKKHDLTPDQLKVARSLVLDRRRHSSLPGVFMLSGDYRAASGFAVRVIPSRSWNKSCEPAVIKSLPPGAEIDFSQCDKKLVDEAAYFRQHGLG